MSSEPHVIVGAGHAARRAAETLRALNADIEIVMFGEEPHAPYDRPVLSKDALASEEGERKAFIRQRDWYAEQRIDLRLSTTVTEIDRTRACVRLHDGSEIGYDRLLLATGSRVRRFGGPVDERVPLHYVRTLADARALRAVLAPGKRVAILGGGFIGLEVAAAATQAGCKATVIEPASALLQRALPKDVTHFIAELHERHGVELCLGTTPRAIVYENGRACIETDKGAVIADIVVVGIGVLPNVELAEAGIGSFCVMALDECGRMRAVIAISSEGDIGACRRLISAGALVDETRLADTSMSLRSIRQTVPSSRSARTIDVDLYTRGFCL